MDSNVHDEYYTRTLIDLVRSEVECKFLCFFGDKASTVRVNREWSVVRGYQLVNERGVPLSSLPGRPLSDRSIKPPVIGQLNIAAQ